MKRKLFRAAALLGILTTLSLSFAGCKKKECFFCGEEKKCKTYETLLGDIDVCRDCENEINSLLK
ncbi:MAG: hypothetical protein J1E35_03515 [Lachnospiraceae bacterium]|nr:hypothetical protein [Lachnospiraceae bacterium]